MINYNKKTHKRERREKNAKVKWKKADGSWYSFVILLLSMTVVSKYASNPENHRKTIESLDEKKADVLKMTATSAAVSTALAAVPGDTTTPVANKLADLTSYFLIILMVVFVEKYMVTLTGYFTFLILVPAACALCISGIWLNKSALKQWAAKIAIFGLVLYFVVPVSMKVSAIIEDTYEISIEQTIKEAKDMTNDINNNMDSEGNIIQKNLFKIKDGVSGFLKKGEMILNNFIEAIAVMLVTSCFIPIMVLLFMLWFVKLLFGIQINVPKKLPKNNLVKISGYKRNSEEADEEAMAE